VFDYNQKTQNPIKPTLLGFLERNPDKSMILSMIEVTYDKDKTSESEQKSWRLEIKQLEDGLEYSRAPWTSPAEIMTLVQHSVQLTGKVFQMACIFRCTHHSFAPK